MSRVKPLPRRQGAVVVFRGKVGLAWLGVRGGDSWFLTRRDAWDQRGWREVTEEKLLQEVGSELQVLHRGGYSPIRRHPIRRVP